MPQIEFDGQGEPIPTIALPPFGGDGTVAPTTLTFTENVDFPVNQYRDLGFTHVEVWCVGAAGGRGGDASSSITPIDEEIWRPVSQDVWDLRLELVRIQDYIATGEWDKLYGYKPDEGGGVMTQVQAENWFNPNHLIKFTTTRQVIVTPIVEAMGGGGGGGGFHKAFGLLTDLPDSVPIIVGKAGGDAGYGQVAQNGLYTPDTVPGQIPPDPRGYPWSREVEILNYFRSYAQSYPLPHSSLSPVMKGEDGGYSSFGDVGKASGGEGGAAGKIWNGSEFVISGDGGDGGIGGQIEAGGGGTGSVAEGVNGSDGIWHPETGIGSGGGGGKGGLPSTLGPYRGDFIPRTVITHLATAGGQGSYSFGDTSVYGQRQFRQPWTYMKPIPGTWSILQPTATNKPPSYGNYPNGTVTYTPVTVSNELVVPGGGGGARPTKNLKAGSRASGYSPDGVVVVRLTQIN